MDLPTAITELGKAIQDWENPESAVIQINLIEEIRKTIPRDPGKAAELLQGTIAALGMENPDQQMNLTLVQSMMPEILAGIQPLPEKPASIEIGILMLGEAISRDERDIETFYNILVQPFIEDGSVLEVQLAGLMEVTSAGDDPVAKSHAELAAGWIRNSDKLSQAQVQPLSNSGPIPMELEEPVTSSNVEPLPEEQFLGMIMELSKLMALEKPEQLKELTLLKKIFSMAEGQPLEDFWYSTQLENIINTHIDNQHIFDSVLVARDFWEEQKKKKMSLDSKQTEEC